VAAVRFTNRAREDLLDIWAHIARHTNLRAADRVYDLIEKRCATLRAHPQIGRARTEIADEARAIVIERWIAFYRIVGSDVQIVRVVDGARDLASVEWTPDP
jgi:toxin ParE1/3/4